MSVRKGDRSEGKLQVLNVARILKKHSLNKVSSKRFPKSTRWVYAIPIVNEVRDLCLCIKKANSVYATSPAEWSYRRSEQVKAHAHLESLYELIEDVYDAGYIDGQQTDYWTGLVKNTDDLLKAWIKSDKERAKSQFNL